MHRNGVSCRQLILWLSTALLAPILLQAGKYSLWSMAVMAVSAAVLVMTVYRYGAACNGRVFRWIQALWLVVISGILTGQTNELWPEAKDFPVVPLALLTVAALSALGETDGTAQVNAIVFWIVAVLLLCVIIAGIPAVDMGRVSLQPTTVQISHWWLFLIPAMAVLLPTIPKSRGGAFLPFVILLFSAWTEGILTVDLCRREAWPFYEASKSVRISAVADRLEPLVSICVTIGYYSIYSLLLTIITNLIGKNSSGRRKTVVLGFCVIASLVIGKWLVIPGVMVSMISLLLWIIAPVVYGIIDQQKKYQNNENNT